MESKKRIRRTTDEIAMEVDQKIQFHRAQIEKLEKRKLELLAPKTERRRKTSLKQVNEAIKESGLTPDDVMKILAKHIGKK